jgi:hypothetical protein
MLSYLEKTSICYFLKQVFLGTVALERFFKKALIFEAENPLSGMTG